MPKFRIDPRTGRQIPIDYGKEAVKAPTFVPETPLPPQFGVDQTALNKQMMMERNLGQQGASNNYAIPASGDPFKDKIMNLLATSTPAVTNTEEFQKMMPDAYKDNPDLQALQQSYQARYDDYQKQQVTPNYTDAQIEEHLKRYNQDGTMIQPPAPAGGGGAYTVPSAPATRQGYSDAGASAPRYDQTEPAPPAEPTYPQVYFDAQGQPTTDPAAIDWNHPANQAFKADGNNVGTKIANTDDATWNANARDAFVALASSMFPGKALGRMAPKLATNVAPLDITLGAPKALPQAMKLLPRVSSYGRNLLPQGSGAVPPVPQGHMPYGPLPLWL